MSRMADVVELTLFRVLQEGLINAHRHSGSSRVDVRVENCNSRVTMRLRDYGKGLSKSLLDRFHKTGSAAGVGLVGMRERVIELGGQFEVQSDPSGTALTIVLPVSEDKGADTTDSLKKALEPA